ncbi:MAG: hypothetical protein R3A10_22540 [Caldilineaceae bacterium]
MLPGEMAPFLNTLDLFDLPESVAQQLLASADEDYDILQYELDEVYDQAEVALPFHENGNNHEEEME